MPKLPTDKCPWCKSGKILSPISSHSSDFNWMAYIFCSGCDMQSPWVAFHDTEAEAEEAAWKKFREWEGCDAE